jgi:hypothetical protein
VTFLFTKRRGQEKMAQAPDFKQPPWVYGSQKEEMEWIEATHPSKNKGKNKPSRQGQKYLRNLRIQFDFNVPHTNKEPSSALVRVMQKITRTTVIEEGFDLIPTIGLLLRALTKIKFRYLETITINGTPFEPLSEKTHDVRKTIDALEGYSGDMSNGTIAKITAKIPERKKCKTTITIKKIHSIKEHSVNIQMKGGITEELYHEFRNYLDEKIGVEELK